MLLPKGGDGKIDGETLLKCRFALETLNDSMRMVMLWDTRGTLLLAKV